MTGLIGEYNRSIDAKGRMSVPSKFTAVLGDSFVISKGLDGCLVIYSNDDWDEFEDKLKRLSGADRTVRELRRFFGAGASTVEVDDHGRILVPSTLIAYAGLTKDITIVGTADGRAEIWDTAKWNAQNEDINPEEAAQSLFEKGIII
ncbi:MAG: division/cell wall cluster transcriptional repressor MraZ [Lachnospiraceae bacterium]|nr:division/cell wall cluster transcriptional repressor MraZ [Lachnospiraceae bacterium]